MRVCVYVYMHAWACVCVWHVITVRYVEAMVLNYFCLRTKKKHT